MLVESLDLSHLHLSRGQIVHVLLTHRVVGIDGIAKGLVQGIAQEWDRFRCIHVAGEKDFPGFQPLLQRRCPPHLVKQIGKPGFQALERFQALPLDGHKSLHAGLDVSILPCQEEVIVLQQHCSKGCHYLPALWRFQPLDLVERFQYRRPKVDTPDAAIVNHVDGHVAPG